MTDQELETLGVLSVLHQQNAEIQAFVSLEGDRVPPELLRLLTDLDWTVRNGYAETRDGVFRQLRRDVQGFAERARGEVEQLWRRIRGEDPRKGDREDADRTDYSEVPLTPEPPDGEAAERHARWEDVKAAREQEQQTE